MKLNLGICTLALASTFLIGGSLISVGSASAATCTGSCGVLGPDGVVTAPPSFGPSYSYVTTNGGLTGIGANVPSSAVGSPTNGSTYQTSTFVAAATDTLQFFFNYVTSDGAGFADYAWAQLLDSSNAVVATIFGAQTVVVGNTSPGTYLPPNSPGTTLTPATTPIIPGAPTWSPLGTWSGTCFDAGCGYTGWIESKYIIAAAGTYSLLFGVTNWKDTIYDSGLAWAGANIGGVQIDPVPIGDAWSLLLTSIIGLGGFGLWRKRSELSVLG